MAILCWAAKNSLHGTNPQLFGTDPDGIGLLGKPPAVKQFPSIESHSYWRMPEILASHENIGVCLKSWRHLETLAYAQNNVVS